ncbi:hypothetical protein WJX74_005365 [Apatococcus lobatus]|uniref:Uncharacterized protein n=1 Tax=Apatococcus lobatus TaxID=904363 RepID=A0AAW1REW7_9CHLO
MPSISEAELQPELSILTEPRSMSGTQLREVSATSSSQEADSSCWRAAENSSARYSAGITEPGSLTRRVSSPVQRSVSEIPFRSAQADLKADLASDPARPSEEAAETEDERQQPFNSYVAAELSPEPCYPTADAIWGETERDRVYNAVIYVPYQLERLLDFGFLICLDSFLAVFTVLPLRVLRGLSCLAGRLNITPRHGSKCPHLRGDQLYDLICMATFICSVGFLWTLNAGAIYFWMKDLNQEWLKLQVIYTAVEIFDKVLGSFGVDALEALSGTCTLFAAGNHPRGKLVHLMADAALVGCLMSLHGALLLCQGMAFSVAMNSKRSHALVALLIASNFMEIKGTVLKRFDPSKLFSLACQDMVERFHLVISLLFVVVEEMDSSGRWRPLPGLLWQCGQIFGAEMVIDVVKHAVLGKFNQIRPGVYQEFMKDVCEKTEGCQSHNIHRVVAFQPFAPAALFCRVLLTLLVRRDTALEAAWPALMLMSLDLAWGVVRLMTYGVLAWVVLWPLKLRLGYYVKRLAYASALRTAAWFRSGKISALA